jgi:molecular chaperone GrpE
MTDPIDDEALLALFRDWLGQTRAEVESLGLEPDPLPNESRSEAGLLRLVEEFTALRHEVKLETKGSRGLQEQVEAILPALRQAIDQFRAVGPKEEQAALAAGRPLAEAIADLDEALDRGRAEAEKSRARPLATSRAIEADLGTIYEAQPWFRRVGLRAYHDQVLAIVRGRAGDEHPGLIDALLEGYDLIRARLRRAMDAGQVRRIECIGLAVDPERMTVVEAVDAPDMEPGLVVDEVRRGYTWRGRVLRYAEVRAARARDDRGEED